MDISLLLKIAGIGVLVAVSHLLLKTLKREDDTIYVSIAGFIIVLILLITEMGKLYETVKSVFGI